MTNAPKTLGEKLSPSMPSQSYKKLSVETKLSDKSSKLNFLRLPLLVSIAGVPLWWLVTQPELSVSIIAAIVSVLFVLWIIVERKNSPLSFTQNSFIKTRKVSTKNKTPVHSLLAHDRQGFMKDLRLDAKTSIIDGSNIYHFGHDNGLDAQPLGLLALQLRDEGYRIVCFFDANIYYTISEHGAFGSDQRHTLAILQDAFGLAQNEIYVVPSGTQADKYVLNTLKHLPESFVVTNDKFRDYAPQFPDVMKGQWRKGVTIQKNELRLLQHKFTSPIKLVS